MFCVYFSKKTTDMQKSVISLLIFMLIAGVLPIKSQVFDDFSDGNFSSNPPWGGDTQQFEVNTSNQLHLNSSIADTSFLSTPNTLIDSTEWSFWIKQSFNSSSNNHSRIYLVSDAENLEGNLNGYFVQVGGTDDRVSLFKQTGATIDLLIQGTQASTANSTNELLIKVTRSDNGFWSLFTDDSGSGIYQIEGSANDISHTATSYFGIFCKYTVSNATKFYFDNFSIDYIYYDQIPPEIVSVNVDSANRLMLTFDEILDQTSAENTANYSVNNGIGNPAQAILDPVNNNIVFLSFATNFQNGLTNVLEVNGIQDPNGNIMTPQQFEFTYYQPGVAVWKDIIINEIFPDPTPPVGLPEEEFIEIYNKSSKNISLENWQFGDGSSSSSLTQKMLLPGEYLILCHQDHTSLFEPYGQLMGLSSFPSLNNTEDHIYLKNESGIYIDSLTYSDTWYGDPDKDDGGYSLELINPNFPGSCPVANNWSASENSTGGTPGSQNSIYSTEPDTTAPYLKNIVVSDSLNIILNFSEPLDMVQISNELNYSVNNNIGTPASATATQDYRSVLLTFSNEIQEKINYTISVDQLADCSGNELVNNQFDFVYYKPKTNDVVFNELMVDPTPAIGLPEFEYIELFNNTSYPINLENWKLLIGTTEKILPSSTIKANDFLLIVAEDIADFYSQYGTVISLSSISLPNTGKDLILKDSKDNIISMVFYEDFWYDNPEKAEGGWSLEKIDPERYCGGNENWTASNDSKGGTPLEENSVLGNNPDAQAPKVLRAIVEDPIHIQLVFNEMMDSTSMGNTQDYTIDQGIGNPIQITYLPPRHDRLGLTLPHAIENGIIYKLSISQTLTDCMGNPIEENAEVRFAIADSAEVGDIVINEVLTDPYPGGVDFVELYNVSNKVFDLQDMSLATLDDTGAVNSIEPITEEGFLFFPAEYIVITSAPEIIKDQYFTSNPDRFAEISDMPSYNNSEGTVILIKRDGEIIEQFTYNENMHFPLLESSEGVSLERIDFFRPANDHTNWHSASFTVGYATPGYKNSQHMGTEFSDDPVSVQPEVFSPDGDGFEDVANINYHFEKQGYTLNISIFSDKGQLVKKLISNQLIGTEQGSFSWDGTLENGEKAGIGIYIFYVEVFDLEGNLKTYKKTIVLASRLN